VRNLNTYQSQRLGNIPQALTGEVQLHGRRYALRVVLHMLETYVNREVATARSAIPLLNISELVVPLAVSNNHLRLAVNASVNINWLNDGRLNDSP
jgi:hypothetical protein